MIASIIAILFLLVLSGFFSGSETALTAASRVRMLGLAKEGNKKASLVNSIRAKKDKMIGALLLGNNLVNILASALATSVLISLVGETGVVYATLVMTFLVLIFAEVLPKTYALHHADTMSLKIAPLIRVVILIFAPITDMVTWIVRMVLRLFGVDISLVQQGSHIELLRGVIDLHQGPEEETNEQRNMLRSILDLADVEVSEIMTHRKNVNMIDIDRPVEEVIAEVMNSPHTRIPLWRDTPENIVGILHAKQLVRQMQEERQINIEEVATEPWFIPDTTVLFDQLQEFRRRREHFSIVVDEYGTFMGIVTLEDILEEIVGEIDDEHDIPISNVQSKGAGEDIVVDGSVTIRDLNREFDWNLPDEDYATLAGLLLHEAKTIPEVGQKFTFYNFQFEVLKRQRNQITQVRLIPPAKPSVVHH